MNEIIKKLNELLNLDGYRDFESAEDLADGYNRLRDTVIQFRNETKKEVHDIKDMIIQLKG